MAALPSKKSRRRYKDNIREVLRPGNQLPWEQVRAQLNRKVRGWASYFCYGTLEKVRAVMDWYMAEAVRGFLRRRHKKASRGARQYSRARVFGELGVCRMSTLPRLRWAHAPP
jgi:hypothetical protein